ncbi:MAG: hypothetical protein WEF28_05900 [Acidimicrobiia bacterium]
MSTVRNSTGEESSSGKKRALYPGRPYVTVGENELASTSRPWAIVPRSMASTWPTTEPSEEDLYNDEWFLGPHR